MGDSLGPLVGDILTKKLKENNITVIGNMKECIDYSNIGSIIKQINIEHNNSYIITVDAALSERKYIGKILTTHKKLVLGSALGKDNYKIGDISIKGVVAEKKDNFIDNFISLSNVPKKRIVTLAFLISSQIYNAIAE